MSPPKRREQLLSASVLTKFFSKKKYFELDGCKKIKSPQIYSSIDEIEEGIKLL